MSKCDDRSSGGSTLYLVTEALCAVHGRVPPSLQILSQLARRFESWLHAFHPDSSSACTPAKPCNSSDLAALLIEFLYARFLYDVTAALIESSYDQ